MAKLADAADLKSAGAKALWGFDSPSRHQFRVSGNSMAIRAGLWRRIQLLNNEARDLLPSGW